MTSHSLCQVLAVDTRPFNLRKAFIPEQIFLPCTPTQVADILREANKTNKKVAARCGGHSYASYGLGGADGAWVIDLQKFDTVKVDHESNTAIIGAGLRLGKVALSLWEQGKKAIPHGLCPRVGIAGHSLHGGYGFTSRLWGLALDSIEEVQVVLPNGDIVFASEEQHPELFKGLLGAGSSFGIVTQFKVRVQDAPTTCIHYWYTWQAGGSKVLPPVTTLVGVLSGMQEYADQAPPELGLRMRVLKDHMEVTGAYWGTEAGFQDAIKPLTDLWRTKNVSPDDMGIRGLGKSAVHERQWPEMLLYMANDDHLEPAARTAMSQLSPREFAKASYEGGVWPEIFSYVSTEDKTTFVEPGQEDVNMDGENARGGSLYGIEEDFNDLVKKSGAVLNDTFFATSLLVKEQIAQARLTALFTYIHNNQPPAEHSWFLIIDLYGGAQSNIKNGRNRNLSCYSFRDDLFTMQFYIQKINHKPPFETSCIKFMHDMRAAVVGDAAFKSYMCYIDPEFNQTAKDYYDDTIYKELVALKQQYDPKWTLWNPQCINAENAPAPDQK